MRWGRVLVLIGWCSLSAFAHAAVTVNITQPSAGDLVGDSLSIAATIGSPYQLASVTATAGTASGNLTTSLSSSGTLDLSGVATGPTTLTVTATDTQGNSGSAQVVIKHDYPPIVAVSAPLPLTVARPNVRVTGTCSDGDAYPCQSLAVRVGSPTGTPLATVNASSMDQVIALDAYRGQQIALYLVATDTAGSTAASAGVPVFVDDSPQLVEVATVPNPIVDVDETRILHGMTIRTRGTTTDVALPSSLGDTCRLSPKGALCNAGEWKDGAVVATWNQAATTGVSGFRMFAARGGYAVWVDTDGKGNYSAWYRDSAADTTTKVLTNPYFIYAGDVGANGLAAYIIQSATGANYFPVYTYSGGTLAPITPTNTKYEGVLIDGNNVIYRQWFLGYEGDVFLYTGTDTLTFTSGGCNLPFSYAVNGGWTAYNVAVDACQTLQVWTRAPDDTRHQLSIWSTSSTIDAVSDTGEVMMFNASSLGNHRYLASASLGPVAVSTPLGRAVSIGGQWYVVMGRSLFSVVLGAGADLATPPPPDLAVAPPDDLSVLGDDLSAPSEDLAAAAPPDLAPSEDMRALAVDLNRASSDLGGATPADLALPPPVGSAQGCNLSGGASPSSSALGLLLLLGAAARRARCSARASSDR